jgi:hypothetical protein
MVLAAKRPKKIYRLFILGRKKLPELMREQHPDQRNWALNVLVTTNPADIRRRLSAVEYPTEARGERFVPAAKPVGEGRLLLFQHGDHTELAYVRELPKVPGPAQEEFDVKPEASYVVAVKNPDISTPGAPSPPEPPAYPPSLKEKFGQRRWIAVDDPALLDYENTQLLLVAAHAEDVEEELGIHIDPEHENLNSAAICRGLRLSLEREGVTPLLTGDFPTKEESPEEAEEVLRLAPEEAPTKAGKIGGGVATRRAPSASALATLLAGIDFPKSRSAIVAYARHELPDRRYESMKNVEIEVGKVL